MPVEDITVSAGGQRFSALKRCDVEHAFDEAALSFKLVVAAEDGGAATAEALKPGTEMEIMFSGELALRGYVDRYQPHSEGKGGREILVSGRSKGQDYVDCAAVHETGHFKSQTILQIAQKLDAFGVGITSDEQLEALDEFQLTPGESAFRAIEKKCRSLGFVLAGQRDGGIKIAKAAKTRHAGGLFEGVNFLGSSADLNWAHRHSHVIVRGQQADGHGDAALAVEAQVQDEAVTRYRPVIIVSDDEADGKSAQERADTRLAREAGEAIRANGKVVGFRDEVGTLWTPGNLVWTESEFLGVTQVMCIVRASFSQSREEGSTANLDLVDPRAFQGKASKSRKSRDVWSVKPSKVKPSK